MTLGQNDHTKTAASHTATTTQLQPAGRGKPAGGRVVRVVRDLLHHDGALSVAGEIDGPPGLPLTAAAVTSTARPGISSPTWMHQTCKPFPFPALAPNAQNHQLSLTCNIPTHNTHNHTQITSKPASQTTAHHALRAVHQPHPENTKPQR